MLKVIGIAACLVLAGCAAEIMKSWLGHPETELLASWGAPDKSARSGSTKIHTWDGQNLYGQIICTTSFVIGADHIVESYSTDCL